MFGGKCVEKYQEDSKKQTPDQGVGCLKGQCHKIMAHLIKLDSKSKNIYETPYIDFRAQNSRIVPTGGQMKLVTGLLPLSYLHQICIMLLRSVYFITG